MQRKTNKSYKRQTSKKNNEPIMIIEFEQDTQKLFPDVPPQQKVEDRKIWRMNFNDTFKLKERMAQNQVQADKIEEEIEYYRGQRIMIKQCAQSFQSKIGQEQNAKMIREMLGIMSQYISYILQLLQDKIRSLNKNNQTQSKINFLTKQNQKMFKALEEQIEESQLYQQQMLCLTERNNDRNQSHLSDIRPITSREEKEQESSNMILNNFINQQKPSDPLISVSNFEDESLKQSRVEHSILQPEYSTINQNIQKNHIKYFQTGEAPLKQNLHNQHKLNYKKHLSDKSRDQTKREQAKIFGKSKINIFL